MTLELLSKLILPEVKEASRKLEEKRRSCAGRHLIAHLPLLIIFNHFRFPCYNRVNIRFIFVKYKHSTSCQCLITNAENNFGWMDGWMEGQGGS